MFIFTLTGLKTDATAIRLSSEVSVGRLHPREVDRVKPPQPPGGLGLPVEESGTRILSSGSSFEEARKEAWDRCLLVITALRLLKAGGVGLGLYGVAYTVGQPETAYPLYPAFRLSRSASVGWASRSGFAVSRDDGKRLRILYRGLLKGDTGSMLALRRFDMAYQRDFLEDRLIDLWVALESLFGTPSEVQELRYKFAMRIAHFIGSNPVDREDIFQGMKDAYLRRSKVVHGVGSQADIRKAARDTEDALRRSLCKAVSEGKPPDPDYLDRLAAQGFPMRSHK